ncbi:MAG: Crp/Fnr family transcriptional regulator [Saprospiraceae bacterium]|nr:Crp/Fnr family transcriptional regulator [Saprospiraceae bacterium]
MEGQHLWYLENIDVTDIISLNKLDEAMQGHSRKQIPKGDYIYLPDQHADKLYFITEGKVKIGTMGENGKEITKALLGKGEVFGELAMMTGEGKRTDFAHALEDTEICIIPATEMKSLLKEHNALSLFFMKLMGSKVLEMEHRLESLVFKDSRSRIIEYLVDLTEKRGQRVGYEWVVRNFLTHQEIANYTATSRQTVTTVLNELRDAEHLTFNRKRLLIRDLEKLKSEVRKS